MPALLARLAGPDYALMRRVNAWRPPRWFRLWMIWATRAGDGWFWAACGVALLVVGGGRRYTAFGAASLAVMSGILIFKMLKRKVGRKRPCHVAPHCWSRLLPPDQFSFPSGHTITAFAVAIPLLLFYRRWAAPLLFCAASVAASRIALGMHFLTDVVAGAAIGCALGYAFSFWLG